MALIKGDVDGVKKIFDLSLVNLNGLILKLANKIRKREIVHRYTVCIRLDSRGSRVLEFQRTEDECASNETSSDITDEFFVYLCTLF